MQPSSQIMITFSIAAMLMFVANQRSGRPAGLEPQVRSEQALLRARRLSASSSTAPAGAVPGAVQGPQYPSSRPRSVVDIAAAAEPRCGDGKCEAPEDFESCLADCPGVTTPSQCGEEPHSDPGGEAVAWGLTHKTASAAECCDRCAAHAADPKNAKKPCNSWVFCQLPQCWSLDTAHKHTFGECWLKWQVDPKRPLYGQRGRYTDEFRKRHRNAHKGGLNVDGTPRNLSVPTHVPWTGGVMGARVDLSVQWETGPEGMRSSTGASIVSWRAWESEEQNRKRGALPDAVKSCKEGGPCW
jgi:hypothetical protein